MIQTRLRWVGLAIVAVLTVFLVLLLGRACTSTPAPLVASFIRMTNGRVGVTNGRWAVYVVTNLTTNTFCIAGARIELRRSNRWELEPTLEKREGGNYWPPPTRAWHDAPAAAIGVGGSFHFFVRAPDDPTPWRASIDFLEDKVPPMPGPSSPALTQILLEDAQDFLDSKLHAPKRYVCPLPEAVP
jgi:hypothetical protein